MLILSSRLRIATIVALVLANLILIFLVVYLTNHGSQYLPHAGDFSLRSFVDNISNFSHHIQSGTIATKIRWNNAYISFQNVGINFLNSNNRLSLIILDGLVLLYGSVCVIGLTKAAYNYTENKVFALITLILCILLPIENVWLFTLLVDNGDWTRSFWANVGGFCMIYGLNIYATHIQGEYYPLYSYSFFYRFIRGVGFLLVPLVEIGMFGFGIYYSSVSITKDVTISAKDGWVSTGLSLNNGENAEITYVNGKWAVNEVQPGEYLYTNGDGLSKGYRTCNLDKNWEPVQNTKPGQLIAKIGVSEGMIPLGNHASIKSTQSGILYLRANDSDYCLRDNAGSVVVRITVHRIDWRNVNSWSGFRQLLHKEMRSNFYDIFRHFWDNLRLGILVSVG